MKQGNCRQLTSDEKHALVEEKLESSNHNCRKYKFQFIVKILSIIESESNMSKRKLFGGSVEAV